MLSGIVGDAMTTRFHPLSNLEPLRPFAVTREQPLTEALERMIEAKAGALPVVDEGEIVAGLTRNAISRYFELEGELGFPLSRIVDELSPRDQMFDGSKLSYLMTGGSALRCIRRALDQAGAGARDVTRILDFACGHGRVLRMLKAAFPSAELTACDVDPDAVEFCAQRFGARPVLSSPRIGEIALDGAFDLIWCGSLLTHIDERPWAEVLALFTAHLADPAALVFSTHGPPIAERLREGSVSLGLPSARIATLLQRYDESGFGYVDYLDQAGYGIAVCSQLWIERLIDSVPGLTQLSYEEGGWARLQDVVACSSAS